MAETTNKEVYQPMTFDAIKIGLASPEKIHLRVVPWRSEKAGDHQLQNFETGKRWFVL